MQENGAVSILELVERQRRLEEAARRRYPWDPSQCTLYMDIPPRQLLYACLTCKPKNAICYACAIRCHAGHNVVELYSKRGYRCDCGTTRIPHSHCTLRRTQGGDDESPNTHLHYGQNFEGKFCVCSESVDDPGYGEGAMFQCLLGTQCGEDWFHARCIVGISREEEKARQQEQERREEELESPVLQLNNGSVQTRQEPERATQHDNSPEVVVEFQSDEVIDTNDSAKNTVISQEYSEVRGKKRKAEEIEADNNESEDRAEDEAISHKKPDCKLEEVVLDAEENEEPETEEAEISAGADIDFEEDESGDELDAVYPELPASFGALICKACARDVPQLVNSEAVLANVNGYIFLKENFGEIVQNSVTLKQLLTEHPYLDGKESTYKPEMDEDQSSLLEAGERALESLPRDAVLDGISRFNELQSNLMDYLRQIGSDGHAITKEEIQQFFLSKK